MPLLSHASQRGPANQRGARYAYTNRLIHESSPYLLMHAHNPVDWYPWGEAAFAKARREQKPIFLSVGYYTCHWCHVMERESYSNPEIAAVLNRWFVAVKVDREERPDVDSTYLAFVEATTGSGGWPMNVVLTPDLRPFFGGTYFSPADLKRMLTRIAGLWKDHRDEIEQSAATITTQLRASATAHRPAGSLQTRVLDKAFQQIKGTYDPTNPGFGGAPRFPRPAVLEFLLRYWKRTRNPQALDMTLRTLHAMAEGGVHDQIGGGFHRYSVDSHWRVPHFEKMLYDQAQLAAVYTEAFQITHDPFYGNVVRDILDFTLREMRDPAGGFYSALDADSPTTTGSAAADAEGAFYVWPARQIESVLGPQLAPIFEFRYGVKPGGNVPAGQDTRGSLGGENILYQAQTIPATAAKFGMSSQRAEALLAATRKKLFAVRAMRPHPRADTKVITGWNGMMISALARAGQVFHEPRYLEAAEQAEALLRSKLYQAATGKLERRYRLGKVGIDGYADDYVWAIRASLDLYEATFDTSLLTWAIKLQQKQDTLFWDKARGGYFSTAATDESLLWRSREAFDEAEPSANSIAASNLIWIWQLTDENLWNDEAGKTLAGFDADLEKKLEAMPLLAAALDLELSKHTQVVIAGAPRAPDTDALLDLVWQRFLPDSILLLADGSRGQRDLARYLPAVGHMTRKDGKATAYVCEGYVCNLPTTDPSEAARLLESSR